MVKVIQLVPGDEVTFEGEAGTLITVSSPHPIWAHLCLVIWWLHEERRYSFDALDAFQELPGEVTPSTQRERTLRLRKILLGA